MKKYLLTIFLLMTIFGFAGCNGLFVETNPNTTNPTTENNITYPNGFSQHNIIPEKAITSHNSTLTQNQNFTLTKEIKLLSQNQTTSIIENKTIDLSKRQAKGETKRSLGDRQIYIQNDTRYVKTTDKNNAALYNTESIVWETNEYTLTRNLETFLTQFTFNHTQTFEKNGETFLYYTIQSINTSTEPTPNTSNIQSIDGNLIVSTNGYINTAESKIIYNSGKETSVKYEFTSVGSTAVKKPRWANNAQNQND